MKTLEDYKRELLKILTKKENPISEFQKSLLEIAANLIIEKGRIANVGEVRMWGKFKFRKIAPNKWRRIYESETYGAKQSIKIIANKIRAAKSVDELLMLVMNNVNRFYDTNGKLLDIVYELKYEVDKKKGELKIKSLNEKGINTFGFPYGKFSKSEYKVIANQAEYAKKRGLIDFSNVADSANEYLVNAMEEWEITPIESKVFENTKVRIDGTGIQHFFQSGQNKRSIEEITKRAKCLPYLRDILENTGMKASCYQNPLGQISFTVMGKAKIDNVDTAIRVVISRKKKGKLFYLSVHNLEEIKKDVEPTNVGSAENQQEPTSMDKKLSYMVVSVNNDKNQLNVKKSLPMFLIHNGKFLIRKKINLKKIK